MGITTRIAVTEARPQIAALVARVQYGGETIILTRHGKDAAMLVPVTTSGRRKRPAARPRR